MHKRIFYLTAALILIQDAGLVLAASPAARRLTFWDLTIGDKVDVIPAAAFTDLACGSNGGAPGRTISSWADFRKCRPEPNGLREITFRYDDELEYVARAHRDDMSAAKFGGTTIYDMPIIASALLDEAGMLIGLRAFTDPRADLTTRKRAYTLSYFLQKRFSDLKCKDLPAQDGEMPVGTEFIKMS